MSEINYTSGRFVWHELVAKDLDKAQAFYSELFNWKIESVDMPGGMKYLMVKVGEQAVAGLVEPQMDGVPNHWLPYISMEDISGATQRAKDNGATIHVDEMNVGIGIFTIMQDPQGGVVALWKGAEGDPAEVDQPGVGTFCWDTLNSTDVAGSKDFYKKVIGWTDTSFEGAEHITVFHRGERQAASMNPAPEGVPSHWMNYIVVENLAAAESRLKNLGGQVMMSGIEVPNVGTFSPCVDNQGAGFALFVPLHLQK